MRRGGWGTALWILAGGLLLAGPAHAAAVTTPGHPHPAVAQTTLAQHHPSHAHKARHHRHHRHHLPTRAALQRDGAVLPTTSGRGLPAPVPARAHRNVALAQHPGAERRPHSSRRGAGLSALASATTAAGMLTPAGRMNSERAEDAASVFAQAHAGRGPPRVALIASLVPSASPCFAQSSSVRSSALLSSTFEPPTGVTASAADRARTTGFDPAASLSPFAGSISAANFLSTSMTSPGGAQAELRATPGPEAATGVRTPRVLELATRSSHHVRHSEGAAACPDLPSSEGVRS